MALDFSFLNSGDEALGLRRRLCNGIARGKLHFWPGLSALHQSLKKTDVNPFMTGVDDGPVLDNLPILPEDK